MRVVGVDACAGGWVAVELDEGRFRSAAAFADFGRVTSAYADARVLAVDIPIGLPSREPRAADLAARAFLGRFRNTVFPTPPRAVLEAASYPDAVRMCTQLTGKGVSRQAFALRARIFDVERHLDSRVVEVHPEVSFRELAGRPLAFSKRTWGGFRERERHLAAQGIELPDDLGALPLIDVVDAAAAAWSASRYARGEALPLPSEHAGRTGAIWR